MAPHSLVSRTRKALAETFLAFPVDSRVLLAVSGGADSMALAASAHFVARERNIQLYCVSVDHGIRPEATSEVQLVKDYWNARGIVTRGVQVELPTGQGPEGDARKARYDVLAKYAYELGGEYPVPVLLGHNADDQAESVLLGLGRGSGTRAISGMPAVGTLPLHKDVPMYRPLLGFTRAELRTVCNELTVPFVDDPTNELVSTWTQADGSPLRRSALRHEILPALDRVLGGGVVQALGHTASMLQDDEQVLQDLAEQAYAKASVSNKKSELDIAGSVLLDCKILQTYPRALRSRVLRQAFLACGGRGGELVFWHIATLDRLVTGKDNKLGIDLPGVKTWRANGKLEFTPTHYANGEK